MIATKYARFGGKKLHHAKVKKEEANDTTWIRQMQGLPVLA